MMIDTHSHMFADAFDEDRAEAIQRAIDAGVTKIVLPNIDFTTIASMQELHQDFPEVCYPTIGLHPTDVKDDFIEILDKMNSKFLESDYLEKVVAIGETGLDYYWDKTYIKLQKEALRIQLGWAEKYSLPIILHTRDSTRDTIDEIKSYGADKVSGVFHCFSGTEEEAQEVLELGFYLGIGGTITFKKNTMRDWLASLPLDRILLETDSPYLTPVPYRGKRNESSYIPLIVEELSKLCNTDLENIAKRTRDNAFSLFQRIK